MIVRGGLTGVGLQNLDLCRQKSALLEIRLVEHPAPQSPSLFVEAIDDGVCKTLDHNATLKSRVSYERSRATIGFTLSIVPMAKGADFPVVAWYIRIEVGVIQMNM